MSEKLGQINIRTGRFIRDTPNGSGQSLQFELYFSKKDVSRLTKQNIGERVDVLYGIGSNLGKVRFYFNGAGTKIITAGTVSRLANTISDKSAFPIFDAHLKDYKSLGHQALIGSSGGKIFMEVVLMPASYSAEKLAVACNTLLVVPGMDGWRKYVSRTQPAGKVNRRKTVKAPRIIASSRATAPIAQQVADENIWNNLNKAVQPTNKVQNTAVSSDSNYFIIRRGPDEQLWLKKSSINVDCFKVVRGQPVINTPNGELTVETSVAEFLAAIEG